MKILLFFIVAIIGVVVFSNAALVSETRQVINDTYLIDSTRLNEGTTVKVHFIQCAEYGIDADDKDMYMTCVRKAVAGL